MRGDSDQVEARSLTVTGDCKTFNHPINHIAISCVDLPALVSWYTRILGFQLIGEIRHFKRSVDPTPFETIFVSYPESLQELKFAVLTSGNGVGVEVFQFIEPQVRLRDEEFEYTRTGFFHICVTDPNPEALLAKIEQEGGRRVGEYMKYARYGLDGHRAIYTQDPWGNVIEVMSLSLERVSSAGAGMSFARKVDSEKSML